MRAIPLALAFMAACSLFLSGCQRRDARLRATGNMTERLQAVREITGTPEAKRHLPALLDCLRNDNHNPYFRRKVILALNQIGSEGADALFKASEDQNPKVRSGVIRSLGCPDPRDERRFSAEDEQQAFPILVRALQDPEPQVRAAAADAIVHVSNGSSQEQLALPYLIDALDDSSREVRYEAAVSIGRLAREPIDRALFQAAVPRLAACCSDSDTSLRAEGAWALGQIGVQAEPAAPALVSALLDEDSSVRNVASDSLATIGRGGQERVLPLLTRALQETRAAPQRIHILWALRKIGSLPRSLVSLLAATLKDSSPDVQGLSAIVLGEMSAKAHDAVPALRTASKHSPPIVQLHAAWAIYKIAGDNRQHLIQIILAALEDDDRDTREAATEYLSWMDPLPNEARPALARLASNDPDERVRHAANRLSGRLDNP